MRLLIEFRAVMLCLAIVLSTAVCRAQISGTTSNPGLNVHLLALAMAFAAVLGDASNYEIGRLFGTRLFRSPNSKIFKQSYLEPLQR